MIAHPTETVGSAEVLAIVAGPAIYLFALVLFRLRMAGTLSRKRLGGGIACLAVGLLGGVAPTLVLELLLVAVLWR